MYKGNFEAWGKIGRAEGLRGVFTGWSPTFFGYSVSLNVVAPRPSSFGSMMTSMPNIADRLIAF